MVFRVFRRFQNCGFNHRINSDFDVLKLIPLEHSHSAVIARYSTLENFQSGRYVPVDVEPTEKSNEAFNDEKFKPKKHPGHFQLARVELPKEFVDTFKKVCRNDDLRGTHKRALLFRNYLKSRKLPIENDEYRIKATRVEEEEKSYGDFISHFLSQEQKIKFEKARDNKIKLRLRRQVYHWEPIDYTRPKSLEYVLAKTAGEYAALCRVFSEIARKDPDFEPETLFDFGSGVGTVVWAAHKYWKTSLKEHMCVDISRDMNDLAELIMREGSSKRDPIFPGVFFRQFYPVSAQRKYNLAVSSYSLMDLPSAKVRLETIDKLWRNTNKYLVLIEQGTNSGFVALNEARDYVLQLYKGDQQRGLGEPKQARGHVFSPCPHDTLCPRYVHDFRPCNFATGYKSIYPFVSDETRKEIFSYVVLKKGERNGQEEKWPRIVKEPMCRGGHVICRLCTADAQLAEAVLTKSRHPRKLYRCARMSSCGDLLPAKVVPKVKGGTTENGSAFEEDDVDWEATDTPFKSKLEQEQ